MIMIKRSLEFAKWLNDLKNQEAKNRVNVRLTRAQIGNKIYLLLCGGDKSTQSKDIEAALKIKSRLDKLER